MSDQSRRIAAIAFIAAGLATCFAGIYHGFIPAHVFWRLNGRSLPNVDDLLRWRDFYAVNSQFAVQLANGEMWAGTARLLAFQLAVPYSMLLFGTIVFMAGARLLTRLRMRSA